MLHRALVATGPDRIHHGQRAPYAQGKAEEIADHDVPELTHRTSRHATLQRTIHHQRIDVAMRGMQKRSRQTTHRGEAERLPEPHRPLVCAHNEVELHRAEATLARHFQRMQTHRASHAAPHRLLCGHVPAICHMRAAATLIGAKEIRAESRSIFLSHEYFMSRREPVSQRSLTAHIARQGVALACAQHRLKNLPDGLIIVPPCAAHQHAVTLVRSPERAMPRLISDEASWPFKILTVGSSSAGTRRCSGS